MGHLVRAGALLVAVLAGTIVLIALPRLVSPPQALDSYGFYGGRDNSSEWATWPESYADPNTCNACHEETHSLWAQSKHGGVSCENCHGPGKSHEEQGTSLTVDTSRELCKLCHDKVVGRPKDFPQVDLTTHGGEALCITCHNPHDPMRRALTPAPQISHTLEGRADCLLCHGRGGIKPYPADHAGRTSHTCLFSYCHIGD